MGTIIKAPDEATRVQLQQLTEIVKLVSKAGDVARVDITDPPPPTGIGNGTWTRVTGVLAELEAMVAIYRQLGGPELPSNVERLSRDCRQMGTLPQDVVGRSMTVLGTLTSFAENFTATAVAA